MSAPKRFDAQTLRDLFHKQRVATMADLKRALGTDVDLTVFRKLRDLAYHTSYSHRGRYYTLDEIARFDELGLWSFRSVWFSRHGTLVRTAETLVDTAEAGYFASELEDRLHVGVKDALRKLVQQERLDREAVAGQFLYCSRDAHQKQRQLWNRHLLEQGPELELRSTGVQLFPDELKAAIIIFFSLLNEKQRRLFAGMEALRWGHGGDRRIASLLGIDEKTVARGRKELLAQDFEREGIRKSGAGRRPVKKNPSRDCQHPGTDAR